MLLYDVNVGDAVANWVWEAKASASKARESRVPRWQVVHDQLRGVAERRGKLDADEATFLREAEQLQIWRRFGLVSMLDYMERVLGYGPKTGSHRMRVARALGDLPQLTDALANNELTFSAVKELVRVATPSTVNAWIQAARGKSVRQVEELVSGHRPGNLPSDPAETEARLHTVTLEEVTGDAYALFRQARQALEKMHGGHLSDSDLTRAFASMALAGPTVGEHSGRATYQIAYNVCRICDRATQDGAGASVPVTPAALEQARCFAQHIGDLDAEGPDRATQDIPPAVVRLVLRRDHGKCQTPGCRSTIGLEIHHIIPRCTGGTHDPRNLTLRCGACHHGTHDGKLRITGTAPDNLNTTWLVPFERQPELQTVEPPTPTAPPSRYASAVLRTDAVSAMRTLGWSPALAKSAVDDALAELGASASLEGVLRAAIKRTPRPTSS